MIRGRGNCVVKQTAAIIINKHLFTNRNNA